MSDQEFNLKNRVTGAVILVCIAVFLTSMLIGDRPKSDHDENDFSREFASRIIDSTQNQVDQSSIKIQPDTNDSVADLEHEGLPENPVDHLLGSNSQATDDSLSHGMVLTQNTRIERVNSTRVITQKKVAPKPIVTVTKEVSKTGKKTGRWILRVGAFKRKSNADRVIKQLGDAGYDIGRSEIKGANDQIIIRVWVGPFIDQKEAVRAKNTINKKIGLNGFVSKLT